jgi:two-component system cell cycle response regulator DivK
MLETTDKVEIKKILIVENDDFYIEILGTFAKLFLHSNTLFAKVSTDALKLCRKEKPEIVILDFDLPGKDSAQFMEKLRDDADLKPTPVIALSSTDNEEAALGIGCDVFLKKPFKVRDLEAKIQQMLETE